MYLYEAIRKRINYYIKVKNISSLYELSHRAGVPKSTINGLLSTNIHKLPSLPTLLHICEGLDISLKEFFDDDVFLNVEDNSEDKKDF